MDIYEPREDSFLLQSLIKEYAFGRVLDMGTGSGIQALKAAESKQVVEVLAVDINPEAINQLNQILKEQKIRKIQAEVSDLFSNVHGKFDLIVFNPPYLPQDKGIEDAALYGGKKGWELSEKFLQQVSKFLVPKGKILFLFSSLTNKNKINEILENHLLEFKEIAKEKFSFEELYVYLIEKSALLRKLEAKNIEQIGYLARGRRGKVFHGLLTIFDHKQLVSKNKIKVAIKIARPDTTSITVMHHESKWLKQVNPLGIGPRLIFSEEDYLVMEFIEGEIFSEWIKEKEKNEIKKVLIKILEQCYKLDQAGISKQEMHHPQKHILIDKYNHPTLIDFERSKLEEKPKNVTQFLEYLCRMRTELKNKFFNISVSSLRTLGKEYRENPTLVWKNILEAID